MATPTVGIDASGDTFTTAIWSDGQAQVRPALFDNDPDGFDALIDWLNSHGMSKQTPIYVENTGVYSEALCYALHDKGYPVFVVEPVKVWKAMSGNAKTDPLDAHRIAEYGHRFADKLQPWQPRAELVEQIHVLLKTREQLVRQRTASKNALTSLKRKVVKNAVAMDAFRHAIDTVSAQIKATELEIARLIQSNPTLKVNVSLLCTIPCLKLLFAAQILVVTNGFTTVPDGRSMAQYIGIAPNAYQSGSTILRKPRSRGYGPSALRKLLHLAARSAVTHKEHYRTYYQSKTDDGKHALLVINNVANKLLRTACAVLRDQQAYNENHRSYNPAIFT